ncbi:hypothetical protein HanPSC8_Chr16g0719381 [Helianthus annuus]|nr:hypothetical protein HanPSC8_Chr16g0719381 [Helianthus annuus]
MRRVLHTISSKVRIVLLNIRIARGNELLITTVSSVSIRIVLLHVRIFTPVSIIRIPLLRRITWFISMV